MENSATRRCPARAAPSLLSVVAPVYNEEATIEEFYARVCTALEGLPFELVLVDDGSSDGSALMLETLAASDPRVRVVLPVAQLRPPDRAHRRPRPRRRRRRGDARRRPAGPARADPDDARPLAGRLRRRLRRARAARGRVALQARPRPAGSTACSTSSPRSSCSTTRATSGCSTAGRWTRCCRCASATASCAG